MDQSQPQPQPTDPIDAQLATLTEEFNHICTTHSSAHLSALPRRTRHHLTSQTRDLFSHYANHGSETRLHHNITQFLSKGNEGMDFTPNHHWEQTVISTKSHLCTVDLESTPLVTELPLHLDLDVEVKNNVVISPVAMRTVNNITHLFALEAHSLLAHLVAQCGNEPIFRSGVHDHFIANLSSLLTSTNSDTLSLTPETRRFFRKVYERVVGCELSDTEVQILAQACRVDADAVDLWFEDETARRRGWWALRQVVAAKELQRLRGEREGMGNGTGMGTDRGTEDRVQTEAEGIGGR